MGMWKVSKKSKFLSHPGVKMVNFVGYLRRNSATMSFDIINIFLVGLDLKLHSLYTNAVA